jgi:hypothetical protein
MASSLPPRLGSCVSPCGRIQTRHAMSGGCWQVLQSPHIIGLSCPYSSSLLTLVWSTQARALESVLSRGTMRDEDLDDVSTWTRTTLATGSLSLVSLSRARECSLSFSLSLSLSLSRARARSLWLSLSHSLAPSPSLSFSLSLSLPLSLSPPPPPPTPTLSLPPKHEILTEAQSYFTVYNVHVDPECPYCSYSIHIVFMCHSVQK